MASGGVFCFGITLWYDADEADDGEDGCVDTEPIRILYQIITPRVLLCSRPFVEVLECEKKGGKRVGWLYSNLYIKNE